MNHPAPRPSFFQHLPAFAAWVWMVAVMTVYSAQFWGYVEPIMQIIAKLRP